MMTKRSRRTASIGLFFLLLMTGLHAWAAVTPNRLFWHGAVLQQGMPVPVWGTANDQEKVTVTFQGQTVSTLARNGKWMVRLNDLMPGGPFTMRMTGENIIEIKDLLVGEVWICSGQSNMWQHLGAVKNAREIVAVSGDPMLGMFTMPQGYAFWRKGVDLQPLLHNEGIWLASGPNTCPQFSAVGYLFARELRNALNIPVGIINAAIGGSYAEEWIRRDLFKSCKLKKSPDDKNGDIFLTGKVSEEWAATIGPAPGALYNDMIRPLIPYAIRGVIWYQGENDTHPGKPFQYRTLFPMLIQNWREDWGQGAFPFLFVQLAPFLRQLGPGRPGPEATPLPTEPQDSSWAVIRESQLVTALNVPNTAMAVITDYGDMDDIHPQEKEPVAKRLALAALALAYKKDTIYRGPVYDAMIVRTGRAFLSFKHGGSGLVAKGGPLTGFAIAGDNRKFFNAQAKIEGERVVVSSPKVPHPAAVRFGWADYPIVNLFNSEGLPASPFRTDNWPVLTGVGRP